MALLELVSSVLLTISQLMDASSDYKLPLAFLAVILVCLVIYGSGIAGAIQQKGSGADKSVIINEPAQNKPGTPSPAAKKTATTSSSVAAAGSPLGTVMSPVGRRSARLAKRRKED